MPGAVRATTVVSGAPAASLPVPTPAATTTTIVVQQQQVPAQAQAIPGQPQKKGLSLTVCPFIVNCSFEILVSN